MTIPLDSQRRMGLVGATFLGVSAIGGGGILALAGVALERTGAGSILAFAINGLIAIVAALSFAELATAYPQSGGTYLFAKRVLSVSAAFAVGRVLILNVVQPHNKDLPEKFKADLAQSAIVLRDSLSAAVRAGARTEALATFGQDPWEEIERVALTYQCTTVLLGMSRLSAATLRGHLEHLVSRLHCNVVIFRCPEHFQPSHVRRALVPIRGSRTHSALRARLLSSLRHRAASEMQVEYLLVLPAATSDVTRARQEQLQTAELRAQAGVQGAVRTVLSDDVGAAIAEAARDCDLLILGLSRVDRSRRVFAEMTRKLIADTGCATLVISERR